MPPDSRFDPPAIQVPAGATVTFRNADDFTHSVSVAGGGFPYLNLAPGASGQIVFGTRASTRAPAPTTAGT
jgi:plastocyanin